LDLSSSDRIDDRGHLASEDAPWDSIKRHLCFIAYPHALQRILLECGAQCALLVVNERHDGPQRRWHHVHSGPQGHLRDKASCRRTDDSLR